MLRLGTNPLQWERFYNVSSYNDLKHNNRLSSVRLRQCTHLKLTRSLPAMILQPTDIVYQLILYISFGQ